MQEDVGRRRVHPHLVVNTNIYTRVLDVRMGRGRNRPSERYEFVSLMSGTEVVLVDGFEWVAINRQRYVGMYLYYLPIELEIHFI